MRAMSILNSITVFGLLTLGVETSAGKRIRRDRYGIGRCMAGTFGTASATRIV